MDAIVIESFGGPEQLSFRTELSSPALLPGHVLIDVATAGINFTDVYQREGIYPRPLPFIPGSEGVGRVAAIGEDVTTLAVGDRVAWCTGQDSYASQVVLAEDILVPIPDSIADDAAASILLQGLTAHFLAYDVAKLSAQSTCLITAGAGGVGLLLTQMAKSLGARVLSVASTSEKQALARAAGADEVFAYGDSLADEIRATTDGLGVDVVFDGVGAATFNQSLEAARVRGLVVLFGAASGAVPPLDPQELNKHGSLFLTRPHLRHFTRTRDELMQRASAVLSMVENGTLNVRVSAAYPLRDAEKAHRDLQARITTGSIVLKP
ncbi:quinone oxidoreductase family protein [Corynebacterium sp. H78]|uniref:quinone oxidoreductase family protein n=1 Tax=Corynebacterium sp. H78 TaxID=3133417 RepID=UPI0030ABF83D